MARTDTLTFRNRVFKQLRAAGLNSVKAKAARTAILAGAYAAGYPEIADDYAACVSFDSEDFQSVYVDDNGIARFGSPLRDELQPLVSTTPSEEQNKLSSELLEMLPDLYSAEGEEKDRLNAIYSAKRDAILAINPHVHAFVADPDGGEYFHNLHKAEYGFRPRGFRTYAQMRDEIESITRNAQNVEFDVAA
ncbi:hypothetical protein [Erythrobacter aureus]|nr:hypothetical protein [Erythrobacter aureus]